MRGWTIGAACLWMATCAAAVDRPATIWRPASTSNYSDRNWDTRAVVDTIVIHTGEGSYWGIISWFQNPSASASSQYVIARNGEITQMVADNDMAWHATYYNSHSIGIETEGFAGDPNQWTPELLDSLADLCAWLCEAYDITPTHPAGNATASGGYYNGIGLVAHAQVQTSGSTAAQLYGVRTDPGVYFPWDAFVQMVQSRMNGAPPAPANLSANAYANGGTASADFSWSPSAGAAGYYVDVAQSQSDLVDMTGTFQNWDVGTSTAVTWNGLAPSTTYFWRVWAYNGAGGNHGYPDGPFTTPGGNRLLLGLGRGGNGRVDVVSGDWAHEAWMSQGWAAYNAANGTMMPACGDVNGDGVDEVVCGLGTYTPAGGWAPILDGATYAVVRWLHLDWSAYPAANGETRPAVGDFDGDGRAEIAIGIGTYTASGGWVYLYDDA
ncbi:MAG: N-acetylmuramoyl-L-alanine amidase, partial [Planctomycetota bacterium]